jgi:hypothetical protein
MECDITNRLPRVVEAFLTPNTPCEEKKRLWSLMEWKGNALLPYADRLLGVTDENGTPINDLAASYYPSIQWQGGGPTNWWNPSPAVETTHGCENGLGLDILKYEGGEVWFKSTGS